MEKLVADLLAESDDEEYTNFDAIKLHILAESERHNDSSSTRSSEYEPEWLEDFDFEDSKGKEQQAKSDATHYQCDQNKAFAKINNESQSMVTESSSTVPKKKSSKSMLWDDDKVLILLDSYANHRNKSSAIWEKVEIDLKSNGYQLDRKQAKRKFQSLFNKYKETKEENKADSDKTCPYYDLLDDMFSEKSNADSSIYPSTIKHEQMEEEGKYIKKENIRDEKIKKDLWSDEAVLLLLHSYEKQGKTGTAAKWEKVENDLKSKGYQLDHNQAKRKFQSLFTKYKETKEHNNKTGSDPKTCPYFDLLDDMFSKEPNVTPVFACSSINPRLDKSKETEALEEVKDKKRENDEKIEQGPVIKKTRVTAEDKMIQYFDKRDEKFLAVIQENGNRMANEISSIGAILRDISNK